MNGDITGYDAEYNTGCPVTAATVTTVVADGRLRVGGVLPTNTDGGGLSACHPGMRGLFLLVEAVRQLRAECGPRQVAGAEVALVHGSGGVLSAMSTVILGTEATA